MSGPESHLFQDAGEIPNNPALPLLLYPGAGSSDPAAVEAMFARNGWPPAWRYTIYSFPHYHSTAHEVLGVYRGTAKIRLGHTAGAVFEVKSGDVIVIPAGVGHENLRSSPDFHVVGAYPPGRKADMMYGKPGERPEADARIVSVPLPESDPVLGIDGALLRIWNEAARRTPGPSCD